MSEVVKPKTKVVVRRLPVGLTPEAFFSAATLHMPQNGASAVGSYFVRGRVHSRAYVQFATTEAAVQFASSFGGFSFIDSRGLESRVSVEFAPSQKWVCLVPPKDRRESTINEDAAFKAFVEELERPKPAPVSAEITLERRNKEAATNAAVAAAGTTADAAKKTPLVEAVLAARLEASKPKKIPTAAPKAILKKLTAAAAAATAPQQKTMTREQEHKEMEARLREEANAQGKTLSKKEVAAMVRAEKKQRKELKRLERKAARKMTRMERAAMKQIQATQQRQAVTTQQPKPKPQPQPQPKQLQPPPTGHHLRVQRKESPSQPQQPQPQQQQPAIAPIPTPAPAPAQPPAPAPARVVTPVKRGPSPAPAGAVARTTSPAKHQPMRIMRRESPAQAQPGAAPVLASPPPPPPALAPVPLPAPVPVAEPVQQRSPEPAQVTPKSIEQPMSPGSGSTPQTAEKARPKLRVVRSQPKQTPQPQ